jgi:hypothetical protein
MPRQNTLEPARFLPIFECVMKKTRETREHDASCVQPAASHQGPDWFMPQGSYSFGEASIGVAPLPDGLCVGLGSGASKDATPLSNLA